MIPKPKRQELFERFRELRVISQVRAIGNEIH